MKCCKFPLIIFLYLATESLYGYSGLKEPETARLKSMAGAGVASILINETPILNPASIVFFTDSTAYYQKSTEELTNSSNARTSPFEDGYKELLIITDTSAGIRGGFSYEYQNVNSGKRKQFSLSFAQNLGKQSAFGIIYKHNDEDSLVTDRKYNQVVLGGLHILSKNLTLGFRVADVLQSEDEYFHYTAGVQYTFEDKINFIADIGSGDVANYEAEGFTKFCVQLEAFKSIFLRYGRFHDKRLNEKGTSIGFSWAGPKLAIDYAVKTSELISEKSDTLLIDEKLLETSIGLTLLF